MCTGEVKAEESCCYTSISTEDIIAVSVDNKLGRERVSLYWGFQEGGEGLPDSEEELQLYSSMG